MRKVIVSDVETVRTCSECGKRLNATPKTYGGRDHTCLDHGEQFDCNTKVVRTELFRGYLHGWYNLADEDGSVPVALVEDPEGHMDTWDVAHVQYETPYTGVAVAFEDVSFTNDLEKVKAEDDTLLPRFNLALSFLEDGCPDVKGCVFSCTKCPYLVSSK